MAFLAVNDAAVAHYGYDREEFLNMTLRDIRPSEDLPRFLEHMGQIRPGIGEVDTVARVGGDEFIVMLEDLSQNPQEAATQTEPVGEKIIATLNLTYLLGGREQHSTCSIGITLFGGVWSTYREISTSVVPDC